MRKIKYVLKKERISLVLLHKTITDQVKGTGIATVPIANLSRIVNGVQQSMNQSTFDRILNAINALRTRKEPYLPNELIGEVENE